MDRGRPEAENGTPRFAGVVFDLDGVVTDTASAHAAAWKVVFDRFLERWAARHGERARPFDDRHDYHAHVDGKSRTDGIRSFLASRDIALDEGTARDGPDAETVAGLANAKNSEFHELIRRDGARADGAATALIRDLRARGCPIAVASSSRNCAEVLRAAGLDGLFDARLDGGVLDDMGLHGKPAPDLFVEAARRLDMAPGDGVLIEDAAAGVAAGRSGGFGLILGVDRGDNAEALRAQGADVVVTDMAEVTVPALDRWFADARALPSAHARWPEIAARIAGRRIALFLDYDGTLTPIVDRPEEAVLASPIQAILARLAARCPVVVISGRDRADVAARVAISRIVYAGSHGFDIAGPGLSHPPDPAGADLPALIAATAETLRSDLAPIPGVIVEAKRFAAAVHYRLAAPETVDAVRAVVAAAVGEQSRLRVAGGKKVFEVRPTVDWDKGRAVSWLLGALGLDADDVVPITIGDDTTDEDAFRALAASGVTILVADRPRRSRARYRLVDPHEVGWFLERLADMLTDRDP
ncbi:MAG: trehalose-phosphatase [Alphaproteobacteria bacterium]|jgi:alpha,alpha-trehalase|nr:trehalose-phosphatase [Alphaproteobacteria bacterium]